MKRFFKNITILFVLLLPMSFCANRKKDVQTYTTAEVNLSARCSMYREALNRRLDSLEKNLNESGAKKQPVTPLKFSHQTFGVE